MDHTLKALRNCGLFLQVDEPVISEVLTRARRCVYADGHTLIQKGAIPESLYIILEGKVGIYNEDFLLAELGALSIMGESFLADATATATTVTIGAVETLEIGKADFTQLSMQYPRLILNIFTINHHRLRTSNDTALKEARSREEKLQQLVYERTEALHRTNAELIATQKFRDQFLANMSHEIRTPMNAIVGLTNLLLKSPLNEIQDKYLHVIKKSGANLLVIINDILDLAKLEAGKMELEQVPFPLHTALQNIHTILNLKAEEKGISLTLDIGADVPPYVLGDETRITQVLMNLSGNAIKFTEKGGVTIKAEVLETGDDVRLIRFGVRDTGIGIPADKIDKIFESFGQASADTTRKFGGTGLGLTISRQLVEMHGGQLSVQSVPGEGSEFYFSIHYTVAEPPAEPDGVSEVSVEALQGKRLLLVEDNAFNQMVAVDTLADMFPGIQVDVAPDGKTAIEMASSNDYQLIFMDIQLPDIDGFEVTRFIRQDIPAPRNAVRICAMTASVTKELIDQCMESGMDDYQMKPFRPEDLQQSVLRSIQP